MKPNQVFKFNAGFTILLLLSLNDSLLAKAPARLTAPASAAVATVAAAVATQVPTDTVNELAKRGVTVTLPGVTEIQASIDAKISSVQQTWNYLQNESMLAPMIQYFQTSEGKTVGLFIILSTSTLLAARARHRQLQ